MYFYNVFKLLPFVAITTDFLENLEKLSRISCTPVSNLKNILMRRYYLNRLFFKYCRRNHLKAGRN